MAESQSQKKHYLVYDNQTETVFHMYATSNVEAANRYWDGDNVYGYDRESFDDGTVIYVVAASEVTPFEIEIETKEIEVEVLETRYEEVEERILVRHKRGDV